MLCFKIQQKNKNNNQTETKKNQKYIFYSTKIYLDFAYVIWTAEGNFLTSPDWSTRVLFIYLFFSRVNTFDLWNIFLGFCSSRLLVLILRLWLFLFSQLFIAFSSHKTDLLSIITLSFTQTSFFGTVFASITIHLVFSNLCIWHRYDNQFSSLLTTSYAKHLHKCLKLKIPKPIFHSAFSVIMKDATIPSYQLRVPHMTPSSLLFTLSICHQIFLSSPACHSLN